jgi:hypothetical protein
MAFKLKAPFETDNTPIYFREKPEGILGVATKAGSIIINEKVEDPKQIEKIILHETDHTNKFKEFEKTNGLRGLYYDDNKVIHNNKTFARKNGKIKYQGKWRPDGWPGFPWEVTAYNAENKSKTT